MLLTSLPTMASFCIKNILAAQAHERTEVLTLGEGVIKYSSMTHNMTETGGLGPDLTCKYILFEQLHDASKNLAKAKS